MKHLLIGGLLLLISFSCKKEDSLTTLTGTWKLTAYQNTELGSVQTEPSGISRSILLQFSDDGTTGTLSGHTVTNSVYGKYELQPGNKMTVSQFGGTKIGEPDWGNRFWDAMNIVDSYDVSTNKLIIYYNQNKEKMLFERQ